MEEKKKDTAVTKQETLAALRNPGELYVVMSAATRMPFVLCDENTYDDEVLLYYRLEDAKEKAKQLAADRYQTAVAKLNDKQLLGFYTSLFTMDVNCLAVNSGTDTEIQIQLNELVARKKSGRGPWQQEGGGESGAPSYSALLMQEMRRQILRNQLRRSVNSRKNLAISTIQSSSSMTMSPPEPIMEPMESRLS